MGQPAQASWASPGRTLTVLNNYPGGGIGDFGASLLTALRVRWPELKVVETAPDGRGYLGQAVRLVRAPHMLLTNVGLTGWGRSGARNLVGFVAIGLHRAMGRPTVVLVHHAIEMFGPEDSGYTVRPWVRWGAHWALRRTRRCQLVTFTPPLADLLQAHYGATSIWLTPLPGGPPRPAPPVPDRPPRVVMVGYLAPYKGVGTYLEVAAKAGRAGGLDFRLIGRPHPILASHPPFQRDLAEWSRRAQELGVSMPGYLGAAALDEAMAGRTVGLLPYSSASGASASFGLYAERGVPVVASDLPEFRFIQEHGAGVILVAGGSDAYLATIQALLNDPAGWAALSERQRRFATANSWSAFVTALEERYGAAPEQPRR